MSAMTAIIASRAFSVTGLNARGVEFSSGTNTLVIDLSASGERPLILADGSLDGGAVGVQGGTGDDTIFIRGDLIALGDGAIAVDLSTGTNLLISHPESDALFTRA